MPQRTPSLPDDAAMRRSYLRVVVTWLVTLAALYGVQEYFG